MKRAYFEQFTELSQFEVDAASVRLLPLRFCREKKVVILEKVAPGETTPVLLGILNPQDPYAAQEAEYRLHRPVRLVRLNAYEIEKALIVGYGQPKASDNVIQYTGVEAKPDASIPDLLNAILADAVVKGASDIHFESYHDDVDLRIRIDGILHQCFTHASPDNITEIISRMKIMAGLDITERRKPQDGRFRATILSDQQKKTVDFRLSAVPSPAGEDVVLRVLDSGKGLLAIEQLGMHPAMQAVFLRLLDNPEGMVLVTGPTGSGKTTTLYSALNHMRDGRRKIITAEDPIEYYIDKINQKQSNPNMNMSELMRSMLRQDPDVVLFGEIRDQEMGNLALTAAETGHVVLSTLHTSDALGAIIRLRGLDLENADISNALLGAVAQRLVRRICPKCIEPTLPTDAQASILGDLLDGLRFFEGAGCDHCQGTGYRGRVGIYELLLVNEELQDLIADGAHKTALRRYVMGNGFRTLVDDALSKIHAGITTADELLRVLPYRQLILSRQDRLRRRTTPPAPHVPHAASSGPLVRDLGAVVPLAMVSPKLHPKARADTPTDPIGNVPPELLHLQPYAHTHEPPIRFQATEPAPAEQATPAEPQEEPPRLATEEAGGEGAPEGFVQRSATRAPTVEWDTPSDLIHRTIPPEEARPSLAQALPRGLDIDMSIEGGIQSFGYRSAAEMPARRGAHEPNEPHEEVLQWLDPAKLETHAQRLEWSLDGRSTRELSAVPLLGEETSGADAPSTQEGDDAQAGDKNEKTPLP